MNETLLGVIVGGIITAFFTFLLDLIKEKREIKQRLLEERKITYKMYVKFLQDLKLNNATKYDKEACSDLTTSISLFASKNIVKTYENLCVGLNEKKGKRIDVGHILDIIRSEIGNEKLM